MLNKGGEYEGRRMVGYMLPSMFTGLFFLLLTDEMIHCNTVKGYELQIKQIQLQTHIHSLK